jgi:hypothetical protein
LRRAVAEQLFDNRMNGRLSSLSHVAAVSKWLIREW